MRFPLQSGMLLLIVCIFGCAKMELVNTSPTKELPVVEYYEPIDAIVHVKPITKTENVPNNNSPKEKRDFTDNDVASELHKMGVFTSILPESGAQGTPDFLLFVKYEEESDHHFAAEMGEAVMSGLTLGLASFGQDNEFDYSIRITGKLIDRNGHEINTYEGIGSYHYQVPKLNVNEIQLLTKAVELSWAHALKELGIRIKQDKANILASFKSRHS